MFTLLDYKINNSKLHIALMGIYGIGHSRGMYLCSLLGLGKSFHIVMLNPYMKDSLRYLISQYSYTLGSNLKLYIIQRFELYIEISIYKGMRFLKGLPWHGQRTISNSRSVRRFVVIFYGSVKRK